MIMTKQEQLLLNFGDKSIIWKPAIVPNDRKELYEGLYECSNIDGKIRDIETKKILPIRPNKGNYMRIDLRDKNGVRHTESVHRIIAATFCSNTKPDEYTVVNHIDGNPMNNDASNLEWTSNKLNEQHKRNVLKPNMSPFRLIFTIKDNERIIFRNAKEVALCLGVSSKRIREGLNTNIKAYKTKGYDLIGFKLNELKDIIAGKVARPAILEGLKLEDYI